MIILYKYMDRAHIIGYIIYYNNYIVHVVNINIGKFFLLAFANFFYV